MRALLILCCRWYHPEAAAARRGEIVDYDPLRIAIALDEQACDRMDLPHEHDCEGADALLMARMAWLHDAQGMIENHMDIEMAHEGFDTPSYVVDVFATHDLPGPEQAGQLAQAWRQALVERAGGSEVGIGAAVEIPEEPLASHDASNLYMLASQGQAFEAAGYSFRPLPEIP